MAGCSSTTDSLGTNGVAAGPSTATAGAAATAGAGGRAAQGGVAGQHPGGAAGIASGGVAGASGAGTSGPSSVFTEVLDVTDEEVADKLEAGFQQLFHGDPLTEAIYFSQGSDQAYIFNEASGEVQTDGLGYGMMISVQLDKQDEFARLWRYTATNHRYETGARAGYLYWNCPEDSQGCPDPNGMQYAAAALLFAANRWSVPAYEDDALEILDVMLHLEDRNGGVVDGVHDAFDNTTHIVRAVPTIGEDITTVSQILPAFTAIFRDRGNDATEWAEITAAQRALVRAFTNTPTRLSPYLVRMTTGEAWVSDFQDDSYRVGLNLAVDHVLHATNWEPLANTLVSFFAAQPLPPPGQFDVNTGSALVSWTSNALMATNGAAAAAATNADRVELVQAVWDMPIPTGTSRYYDGTMYLLSLLVLGGEMNAY
jgi:oligosaccharide reducing-end xylanase